MEPSSQILSLSARLGFMVRSFVSSFVRLFTHSFIRVFLEWQLCALPWVRSVEKSEETHHVIFAPQELKL